MHSPEKFGDRCGRSERGIPARIDRSPRLRNDAQEATVMICSRRAALERQMRVMFCCDSFPVAIHFGGRRKSVSATTRRACWLYRCSKIIPEKAGASRRDDRGRPGAASLSKTAGPKIVSRTTPIATLLFLVALTSTGCGLLRWSSSPSNAEVRAVRIYTNDIGAPVTVSTLQAQVMRFADVYATTIAQGTDDLSARAADPEVRLGALRWKLGQATSAFVNAAGPNPVLNALDMLVLVTLSRMVAEDDFLTSYGDAARPLVEAHRKLEADAWQLASSTLKPPQQQELRDLIAEWREKNPNQKYIGAIRFREFAAALGRTPHQATTKSTSIFSLLFLDPFSGLDPTAAAIEETRLLGERAMYYSQRMPMLLSWQTELLAYQLAAQPESKEMLADAQRLVGIGETFGKSVEQLPSLVAKEREAAIKQLFDEFDSRQTGMRTLLAETRQTLNAGSDLAVDLNSAVQSLSDFARFVSPTNASGAEAAGSGKPFDITDYAHTADRIGSASRDLNLLLVSLSSNAPALARLSSEAAAGGDRVVRHAAWLGAGLIVLLTLSLLIAGVAYRVVTVKWLPDHQVPSMRLPAADPHPSMAEKIHELKHTDQHHQN